MTPLEKRLAETVSQLLDDSSVHLANQAALMELIGRRVPGFTAEEQAIFLRQAESLNGLASVRAGEARQLRLDFEKLSQTDFPLS